MSGSGVVHSFLEVYLVGHRFHVYSDHQALQSVMSNRCPNKRGTCWSLFLQLTLMLSIDLGAQRKR